MIRELTIRKKVKMQNCYSEFLSGSIAKNQKGCSDLSLFSISFLPLVLTGARISLVTLSSFILDWKELMSIRIS